MHKHHLSKKLFFAGLVLFIIGAIGVAFTMNTGKMIEKENHLQNSGTYQLKILKKLLFLPSVMHQLNGKKVQLEKIISN